MDPLSSFPAKNDIPLHGTNILAESSLSENPTADRHFKNDSEEIDDASTIAIYQ